MALDKEKNTNLNELSTSADQSEVAFRYKCSKSYLMAMLQDMPDVRPSVPRPLMPSTSRNVQHPAPAKPLQIESVLMGLSGDGKRLLLLPSNMKPQPVNTPPALQAIAPKDAKSSENVNSPKRPLDGEDSPEEPNKVPKTQEEEQPSKKDTPEMGPRCNCKLSIISKKFHCNEFTEEDRKAMFDDFWKNEYQQRKKAVCALVKCGIPKARRRAGSDPSRKEFAFSYNLRKNGELLRVCKVMFLATLNLGDTMVRDWVMWGIGQNPFVSL